MTITEAAFGTTAKGPAKLFTLKVAGGIEVKITNYGGIITSISAPDREGKLADVVLGYDEVAGYEEQHPYFGAIIGRYGNRIANGQFTLGGTTYTLPQNNGPNTLHGGVEGFDDQLWVAEIVKGVEDSSFVGLKLSYLSEAGEEGFPGNLDVTVTYILHPDNSLQILQEATTDAPTPVNLTNHTYFNLTGKGRDILGHELELNAKHYTPVDETLIPTGEIAPVAGTPFDFTTAKPIGQDINAEHEQITFGGGFDHNFVLDGYPSDTKMKPRQAATVYEPTTGRVLTVSTDQPGVQFYTGNFLNGTLTGKEHRTYTRRSGFCLEAQHFPDSPNQDNFPSTILRPGGKYARNIFYAFSVRD
ncbi:MAG: aldose epimerase family protein [Bacteroidota bacterium]